MWNTISEGDAPHTTRKNLVTTKLKKTYEEHWLNKIRREPKMRTYVKFKSSFIKEDYLHIKHAKLRHATARLLISAHNLLIERGRYARPPIPPEERVCRTCSGHQTDEEYHFMMACEKYKADRDSLCTHR